MPLKWFLIAGLSFAIGFSGWAALAIWMMPRHPFIADIMNVMAAIGVVWLIFRWEKKEAVLVGRVRSDGSQNRTEAKSCESD